MQTDTHIQNTKYTYFSHSFSKTKRDKHRLTNTHSQALAYNTDRQIYLWEFIFPLSEGGREIDNVSEREKVGKL